MIAASIFTWPSLVAIHGSRQPLCRGPFWKYIPTRRYTADWLASSIIRCPIRTSDIDTTALHCNSGVIIFACRDLPTILLMTAARHPRKVIFNERLYSRANKRYVISVLAVYCFSRPDSFHRYFQVSFREFQSILRFNTFQNQLSTYDYRDYWLLFFPAIFLLATKFRYLSSIILLDDNFRIFLQDPRFLES